MNKILLISVSVFLLAVFSCSKNTVTAPAMTATITPTPTISATFTETPVFSPTTTPTENTAPTVNVTPPASTVKMIFIHHSTGSNWIQTGYGNLGSSLNASNFFTTESDYNWASAAVPASCTAPIGDHTDTYDWPCWFNDTTMPSVYASAHHEDYPVNTMADPGGENEIIMFKACFPNSEVGSAITDEQAIYNGLLPYFAAHTDKMFVLIIPPPMQSISNPAKTRELSNWLADRENGWLSAYTQGNVFAFDYYSILTHPDNHHYILNGHEQHIIGNAQNTLYYPTGDDHPNATGQQKATSEFVPLLKAWWNQWQGN